MCIIMLCSVVFFMFLSSCSEYYALFLMFHVRLLFMHFHSLKFLSLFDQFRRRLLIVDEERVISRFSPSIGEDRTLCVGNFIV